MKSVNLGSQRGFSLVEVVITVGILAVLASLSYPAIRRIQSQSEERALNSDVMTMNRAVSAYLASGGEIPASATATEVIAKLKTKVSEEMRAAIPGFSSSFIDPRLTAQFIPSDDVGTNRVRAAWDPAKQRFYTTREPGTPGIKQFSIAQTATQDQSSRLTVQSTSEDEEFSPVTEVTDAGGARSNFAFQFNPGRGWIWDYQGDAAKEVSLTPSVFSTTSVSVYNDTPLSVGAPASPPETAEPPVLVPLDPPAFTLPGGDYPIQSFNMTVDLVNPNPAGISDLVYSINYGIWQYYPGGGIAVTPDSVIRARTVPNGAGYQSSALSEARFGAISAQLEPPVISTSETIFTAMGSVSVGLSNPNDAAVSRLDYRINGGAWQTYGGPFVLNSADWPGGATIEAYAAATSPHWTNSQSRTGTIDPALIQSLMTPSLTTSAPNFEAGTVETISVTVTNPNASGSALEYRLNGGAWLAYSSPFNVTRAAYPTGLTVEARARATSAAYLDSPNASANIGLTPVGLLTPSIAPSAPNFMAGSVETISVTVSNPNAAGSALDYRINSGSWQAYTGAFNVTRSSYPIGLTVEARARATAAAYSDSGNASATIGLTPVTLLTPSITPSAPNFLAGSVETISVTVNNPNAAGSAPEYRINGGSWQAYTGAFNVTRAAYPTGLTVEARARATSSAYLNSGNASATIGLTPVTLLTPSVTPSAPNFMAGSVETISVTVTNPNAAGSALEYRINSGSWQAYAGAFNVTRAAYPTGLTVEARARATDSAYLDSSNASATIGLTPVMLLTPAIAPSAPNFMADSVETISVTVTNPNAAGSALDYRINGGSWQAYTGAFDVTRAAYPTGLTVEARARATSAAYLDSGNASATIGLTLVQLQAPNLAKSAPNFYASIVETITVTITNPNAAGSALEYRINSGAWQAYTSSFNVTRAAYPTGLTVEARARATNAAYIDSTTASMPIGVGVSQLLPPVITPSAPNFMAGSVETITFTLTNPNPSGSSTLQYRINGGAWTNYSSPFSRTRSSFPTGFLLEARARNSNAAYTNSVNASVNIGLTPVQLQPPVINRSAPNFMLGSVESITVTVTNPNATGSALDFRINGGAWQAYSSSFNVTRATYPTGLTVEARARATNAAYANSDNATVVIGLTPVQLQAPSINRSAPNFIAGSVETISVTVTNPNATGSALEYRINGGAWQAYTSTLSVTRATYPTGLTVEARARATNAAYADSPLASAAIGLTPVQLQVPLIQPSDTVFTRGVMETLSVSLVNPNTTGSALDYRLNGGAWQPYSGAFTASIVGSPSGVVVEARARATEPAYSDSANSSATLGVLEALMTKLVDADADTSIAVTVPNWSGDIGQLYVQDHESSRSLIYFNLTDDITGPAKIRTATLYTTITAGGAPAGFPVYGVRPGLNWTGGGLTWNTSGNGLQTDGVELDAAPTATSVLCTTIPGIFDWSNRRSWDITTLAQRWVNNTAENNGVAIFPTAGNREIYCSREHPGTTVRPKLYLEWNPITMP